MATIHPLAIHVGNIGQAWSGNNPAEAQKQYSEWCAEVRKSSGRASGETVTLFRNGEPWREYDPNAGFYFVEVTDTYGGDANYSWVRRYKVRASSIRGAIGKVSRDYGASFRADYNDGTDARYDARGMGVCAFVSDWDESAHGQYLRIKEL